MKKPYVICHMMTAVDGRIDCAMTEQLPGVQEYYSTLDSLAAPSRVSGRVTAQLEMASPGIFEPQDAALGHESFSRNADADGYEIVIDTRGTLLWDEPDTSERPLLIVTSERVSRDYIAYLDGLHISWIACGKERVDLARACEILASAFGVERMAVVGGGHINAASGGGQLLLCAAASGASPSATRNIASLFKKGFALFKQIGSRSAPRAKCFLRRVRREKFPALRCVYFCAHGTQKYAQRSENARPKGQRPLGRSVFRRGTGTRRSADHFRR